MKKIIMLIALIILIANSAFGQYSIGGTLLAPAADTTILKTRKATRDGTTVYLTEIASGKGLGSGWFVYADSTYTEGVVAFGAGTSGKQWIRKEYYDKREVNSTWIGDFATSLTKLTALDTNITLNVVHLDTITSNTTVPAGISLKFRSNGFLNVTTGDTLTILSDVIEAGPKQVFYGNGIVKLPNAQSRVEWFGDTTDGDSMRATLARAVQSESKLQFRSGVTYTINDIISPNNVYLFHFSSDGPERAKIIQTGTNDNVFSLGIQDAKGTTTLADTAIVGDSKMTVADATVFTAGDLVRMYSDSIWYGGDVIKGEILTVWKTDEDTVFFHQTINDNYDPTDETVTFSVYEPVSVYINGLELESNYLSPASTSKGIALYNCAHNSVIENCYIHSFGFAGIEIYLSYGVRIFKNTIENIFYQQTGYGVQVVACRETEVAHNTFNTCRRGVDVAGSYGPDRFSMIHHNFINAARNDSLDASYGLGSHQDAEFTEYSYNILNGITKACFMIRGKNETISNNLAVNLTHNGEDGEYFAIITNGGRRCSILNNRYHTGLMEKGSLVDENNAVKIFVMLDVSADSSRDNYTVIRGNEVWWKDREQAFFSINQNAHNVIIEDNTVAYKGATTGNVNFLNTPAVNRTLTNSIIRNNNFIMMNNTFTFSYRVLFGDSCTVDYDLMGTHYNANATVIHDIDSEDRNSGDMISFSNSGTTFANLDSTGITAIYDGESAKLGVDGNDAEITYLQLADSAGTTFYIRVKADSTLKISQKKP